MGKGITPADSGLGGISWNVVGHTYVPKLHTPNALIWHATIPADTFVPPHIHSTQDEWVTMLEGELEVEFLGDVHKAGPGDTAGRIKLARGSICSSQASISSTKTAH